MHYNKKHRLEAVFLLGHGRINGVAAVNDAEGIVIANRFSGVAPVGQL